jgi:paired amphipathic helix protein Sin3a
MMWAAWVSHPSFSNEDSVFMTHEKNLYEEALHRTEEERHGDDFYIDALLRTIGLLQPVSHKTPNPRMARTLSPNRSSGMWARQYTYGSS